MIDRAYGYGLGAGAQSAVVTVVDLIQKKLDVTMALGGIKSVSKINAHVLRNGTTPAAALGWESELSDFEWLPEKPGNVHCPHCETHR